MLVNKFFPVKYDKSLATCVQSRLNSDFIQIIKDPVEHVEVIRDPKNKQEWHFVVRVPKTSLLTGYFFHGRIVFPLSYPFKPPMVVLISPPFYTCVLPYSFISSQMMEVVVSPYGSILNPPWNPIFTATDVIMNVKQIVLSGIITNSLIDKFGALDLSINHQLKKNKENLENPLFCKLFPNVVEEIIGGKLNGNISEVESSLSDFSETDEL